MKEGHSSVLLAWFFAAICISQLGADKPQPAKPLTKDQRIKAEKAAIAQYDDLHDKDIRAQAVAHWKDVYQKALKDPALKKKEKAALEREAKILENSPPIFPEIWKFHNGELDLTYGSWGDINTSDGRDGERALIVHKILSPTKVLCKIRDTFVFVEEIDSSKMKENEPYHFEGAFRHSGNQVYINEMGVMKNYKIVEPIHKDEKKNK